MKTNKDEKKKPTNKPTATKTTEKKTAVKATETKKAVKATPAKKPAKVETKKVEAPTPAKKDKVKKIKADKKAEIKEVKEVVVEEENNFETTSVTKIEKQKIDKKKKKSKKDKQDAISKKWYHLKDKYAHLSDDEKKDQLIIGELDRKIVKELIVKIKMKAKVELPDKYVFDYNSLKGELRNQKYNNVLDRDIDYLSNLLKRHIVLGKELIKNKILLGGRISIEFFTVSFMILVIFLSTIVGAFITPTLRRTNITIANVADGHIGDNTVIINTFDSELHLTFEGAFDERKISFVNSIKAKADFLHDLSFGVKKLNIDNLDVNVGNINDTVNQLTINEELYGILKIGRETSILAKETAAPHFITDKYFSAQKNYIVESSDGFKNVLPNVTQILPRDPWTEIDDALIINQTNGKFSVQRIAYDARVNVETIVKGYLVEYVRRLAIKENLVVNAQLSKLYYSYTGNGNNRTPIIDPRCKTQVCDTLGYIESTGKKSFQTVTVNDSIRGYDEDGNRWSVYDKIGITRSADAVSQITLYSEANASFLQSLATLMMSKNSVAEMETIIDDAKIKFGVSIDYVYTRSSKNGNLETRWVGKAGGSKYYDAA